MAVVVAIAENGDGDGCGNGHSDCGGSVSHGGNCGGGVEYNSMSNDFIKEI